MKIEVNTESSNFAMEVDNCLLGGVEDVIKIMERAERILYGNAMRPNSSPYEMKHITEFQVGKTETETPKQEQERENYGIRDRLPNNVVDIESLDVKQAIQENCLVRCPHCGQAHALVVRDKMLYLMRKNYQTNEFEIVSINKEDDLYNIVCKGKETCADYFDDLQKAKVIEEGGDFVVNNDTEIFCPVCHHSNTFFNWKDAWENPLHFFEYENVCEVCGDEMSIGIKKEDSGKKICESCGAEVGKDGIFVLEQQEEL